MTFVQNTITIQSDLIKESLEKAVRNLESSSDRLREALNNANAVESLLLLPMIKKVNETRIDVEAFLNAKRSM